MKFTRYIVIITLLFIFSGSSNSFSQEKVKPAKAEILLLDFVLEGVEKEKYPLFKEYFEKFLNDEGAFTVITKESNSVRKLDRGKSIIVSAISIGRDEDFRYVIAGRIKKSGKKIYITSYLVNCLTKRTEFTFEKQILKTMEFPQAAKENAYRFAEEWKNYNKTKKFSTTMLVPGLSQLMHKRYVRGSVWLSAATALVGYYIYLGNSKEFLRQQQGLLEDYRYYVDNREVSGIEFYDEKDSVRNKKVAIFAALVATYAGSLYDAVKIKKGIEEKRNSDKKLSYNINYNPFAPGVSLSIKF